MLSYQIQISSPSSSNLYLCWLPYHKTAHCKTRFFNIWAGGLSRHYRQNKVTFGTSDGRADNLILKQQMQNPGEEEVPE